MLKHERKSKILELIEIHEYLTVSEIAKDLNVSEMTIRRDISELDSEGRAEKLYGGIKKKEVNSKKVFTTEEKKPANIDEKRFIGKVMNSIIKDNATIFLAAGTTIYYALSEIKAKNLFVVTNSLIAFNYIKENTDYRTLLTGGEFNKVTDEFYGPAATRSFENLNIDVAFAATNGINGRNITTSSIELGDVENAAFNSSRIRAIVADSSKLGKSDVYTFTTLDKIDYLITDYNISNEDRKLYSQYTTVLDKELA